MGVVAGWKGRVRVAGAPLVFTNEGTTANGGRTQYQISNAVKRVFDPQVAITVQTSPDGATWTGATGYTLNRLTGTVSFAVPRAVGTQVRMSGQYLPLTSAAGSKGFSYTITATQLDGSDFDSVAAAGGFIGEKVTGQYDCSGTLTGWDQRDNYFAQALLDASVVVLELSTDRNAPAPDLVVWAMLSKSQIQSANTALNTATIDWTGASDADGRVVSG